MDPTDSLLDLLRADIDGIAHPRRTKYKKKIFLRGAKDGFDNPISCNVEMS